MHFQSSAQSCPGWWPCPWLCRETSSVSRGSGVGGNTGGLRGPSKSVIVIHSPPSSAEHLVPPGPPSPATLAFAQEPGVASMAQARVRDGLVSAADGPWFHWWPGPCHLSRCGFLFDSRCYCFECVDTLVGPGTSGKVQALNNWVCFLCLPLPSSGLLRRRPKWRGRLKAFYDREAVSGRVGGRGGASCARLAGVLWAPGARCPWLCPQQSRPFRQRPVPVVLCDGWARQRSLRGYSSWWRVGVLSVLSLGTGCSWQVGEELGEVCL